MPPQLPFTFNDTVESIQDKARAYIALQNNSVQNILDSVKSTDEATFHNTILPYSYADSEMRAILDPLFQYKLAANQDIYEEVKKVYVNMSAAFASTFLNEGYFQLVDHVFQTNENGTDLDVRPE